MLKEFKEFINRGNVVDFAVAVVLGVAFGAVVTSFVENVLTPLIAAIGGEPNFEHLSFHVGDGEIRYGAFLNAVIYFLIVAFALFVIVKALNRMQRLRRQQEVAEAVAEVTEIQLLTEIRDELRAR
jgi:large conductance mechanosensitive channel